MDELPMYHHGGSSGGVHTVYGFLDGVCSVSKLAKNPRPLSFSVETDFIGVGRLRGGARGGHTSGSCAQVLAHGWDPRGRLVVLLAPHFGPSVLLRKLMFVVFFSQFFP